jgi:hypothetical protein
MKRKLLLELNEMRKMMGLPLLIEQVTPATKKVLNLVGYTDSSIDNLAKQADLSDLSKISDEFASMGIKTMEDWQTLASKQGIDLKTATDDQILKLIDSTPNLKSSILKAYNDKVTKLTNELIANADVKTFLPANMQTEVTTVMSKELTDENSDIIVKLVDTQLGKLDQLFDNLQKSRVEIPEPLQKLYDNLTTKKEDALNFKTKKSNNVNQNVNKVVEPEEQVGFKGQKDFAEFSNNWKRQDVENGYDPNSFVVIKGSADEIFTNLPTQFDPSQVKLGKTNTYEFFGREGELRKRTQIEVTLPNGKKTLMYSSSGANEATTGKKAGEWFWIPGFAKNGWYIKTAETVAYTKGGNQYMTEFANFLEKNGYNGLGQKSSNLDQPSKIVTPQNVSSNRLTSIIGDTSKVDWSKVTNAKNAEDYGKLIDDAINTNDYTKISRGGFEEYGIPNFRAYLMDLDLKGGDVSSDMLQGNSVYQMNRDIFDLYQAEGGASPAFYDWLKTLPNNEMEDLYTYINSKK